MDYTLSRDSTLGITEESMMLYGQEAAIHPRTTATDQSYQSFASHTPEVAGSVLQHPYLNISREDSSMSDSRWRKFPAFSLSQNFGRQESEMAHHSISHQSTAYETADFKYCFLPNLPHTVVNIAGTESSSATHSSGPLSPTEFVTLERKVKIEQRNSGWSSSPPKEQKYAPQSDQGRKDSQSRFIESYPDLISPCPIRPPYFLDNQAYAAYTSLERVLLPTVEEQPSPSADELDDECHHELNKTEELEELHEPPYSQLICRAIMSSPKKQMRVREIYTWFQQNTNKCENPDSTGWQNSIRHNLSMNAVSIWQIRLSAKI
jgi:hypothetical protein